MKDFSSEYLRELISQAESSRRRRQHRNIHLSYDDPCQRLFNAICVDSYIRPHRHRVDPKHETMVAVRGSFALILFDDAGVPGRVVRFAAGCSGVPAVLGAGVELDPHEWHTVLAGEEGSVLLELKAGPFLPDAPKELAPWAPPEESNDAPGYMRWLRALAFEGGQNLRAP
jgi:cupin fold WbuC family metalloprotein